MKLIEHAYDMTHAIVALASQEKEAIADMDASCYHSKHSALSIPGIMGGIPIMGGRPGTGMRCISGHLSATLDEGT